MAVSSLITFDGFRAIYPRATNKQLVWCSRIGICVWAVVMGVSQTVVYKANIPVYLTGAPPSASLGTSAAVSSVFPTCLLGSVQAPQASWGQLSLIWVGFVLSYLV